MPLIGDVCCKYGVRKYNKFDMFVLSMVLAVPRRKEKIALLFVNNRHGKIVLALALKLDWNSTVARSHFASKATSTLNSLLTR